MKKPRLLLFIFLLLTFSLSAKKRYVAVEDIVVKESRSNYAEDLGVIKKGSIVVTEDSAGKWRKVKDQGEVGYILAKDLRDAPPEEPGAETASNEDLTTPVGVKKWAMHHVLIAVGGVIVLLLIVRSMMLAIAARKKERTAVHYEEKYKSLVKYWFQCKHCGAAIKNDSEPRADGCSKSLHHLWFQLGEVGQHKYHCKNCMVTVHTKNPPQDHGCPAAPLHRWEKKR